MSTVTRREKVAAPIMEPTISGDYQPHTVQKFSWRCDGCGLVWPMRHQAEGCEARGHVASFVQTYARGPVINGRPTYVNEYERHAIRREKNVVVSDASDKDGGGETLRCAAHGTDIVHHSCRLCDDPIIQRWGSYRQWMCAQEPEMAFCDGERPGGPGEEEARRAFERGVAQGWFTAEGEWA